MLEIYSGFDIPTLTANYNWDTETSYVYGPGRFGGYSINNTYFSYNLTKTLSNQPTRIVGWANQISATASNSKILAFLDYDIEQISLQLTPLYEFQVWSGSVMLATTARDFIRASEYHYYEFSATIGFSGAFKFILDEINTVFNFSSVNTQQSSNAYSNRFRMIASGNLDDLYCLNTSGLKNNTFLGEQKIITSSASSDESISFIHNTGPSNFSAINSEDSNFNFSKNIGDKDLFGITPLTEFHGNKINAVQTTITVRKDDVGVRKIANVAKVDGTEIVFPDFLILSSETSHTDMMENNPTTSVAWIETDVDSSLMGYKITE
jgi:hypothetical protein